MVYKTTIPANTSAILYLPVKAINQVKESGKVLSQVNGISNVKLENGEVIMTLVSGQYTFEMID